MADYGGTIIFRLPNGERIKVRGNYKRTKAPFSYEKVMNHDNSHDRTVKPEGYESEISFADQKGLDWGAVMAMSGVTVSFIEETNGTITIHENASFLGQPQSDRMTGEVTGVKIVSDTCREI